MRMNRICVFWERPLKGWVEGQTVLTAVSPLAAGSPTTQDPGHWKPGSAESAHQSWPLLRPTLTRQPAVPAPARESVLPG